MKSFLKFLLFVLILSIAVAGLINMRSGKTGESQSSSATGQGTQKPALFTPADGPKIDIKDVNLLAEMNRQYTTLVKAVVPSVVSITSSRTVRFRVVDPWAQLFNRRSRGHVQERKQASLGSGVIVSKEGHIITNHHVIDHMDEVMILLSDGRELPAKIIASDKSLDLAVLKIQGEDLQPLALGDSSVVEAGQVVFAIGNPFGLEETVTSGIVSAVGRRMSTESANEFIQTDTPINQGNSGGPLVNLRGEIIGINNQIFSPSAGGAWAGLGFAIPSNTVRHALESVLSRGRIVRGYLGIAVQPLTEDLASQFGVKEGEGVVVAQVGRNTPGAAAGLKPGDVILKVNGDKVTDTPTLVRLVSSQGVDSEVKLDIVRDGKAQELIATIGEMPEPGKAPSFSSRRDQPERSPAMSEGPLRGVAVKELSRAIKRQLGLDPDTQGVVVAAVERGARASQVLQPGDVIEEIDRQAIRSLGDYEKIVKSLDPDSRHMLFVNRQRTRSFVVINP